MKINQTRKQQPHYGSIEDFLNNHESEQNPECCRVNPEHPWVYDFKYEYLNGNEKKYWNLDEEEDRIKRILKYKHDKDNEFDCDGSGDKYSCDLTREIYRKLWDWNDTDADGKKQRYGTLGSTPWVAVGPDTMNSFMTMFILFSKETWNKEVKNVSAKKLYKQLVKEDGCSLEKYLEDSDITNLWNSFAVFTHSIGNFVLVPAGFNGKRGMSSVIHDFWDLSLVYLKRRIKETTWLSTANAFTKYINSFFLWDYVSYNDDTKDYRVKSLLSENENFKKGDTEYNNRHIGISEGDSTMPKLREICNFLENSIWAIKRRGIFMTAMLQLRMDNEQVFKKLRNEVFLSGNRYCGYNTVIDMITNDLTENAKKWLENDLEFAEIIRKHEEK